MKYDGKGPRRKMLRRVTVNPRRERALPRAETQTYPNVTPRENTRVAYVQRLLHVGAGVSVRLSPSQRTWYAEPVWRDDQAEHIEVGQRAAHWDDWDATLWKYDAWRTPAGGA